MHGNCMADNGATYDILGVVLDSQGVSNLLLTSFMLLPVRDGLIRLPAGLPGKSGRS